jgi:ABC-2 type transport system permease protein
MRKEIFHIWRDPRTLAMLVLLPALLLILLGFGISFEQQSVKMAVADFSKTDASRNLISQFTASNDFVYEYDVLDENALIGLINRDAVDVGILISEDYDRNLVSGKEAKLLIYIDGSMQPHRFPHLAA